jgi:hypothetical protein
MDIRSRYSQTCGTNYPLTRCSVPSEGRIQAESSFFRNVFMYPLNYTMSYIGRQQDVPKRRYVLNKLHDVIYTETECSSKAFVTIYRTTPPDMESDSVFLWTSLTFYQTSTLHPRRQCFSWSRSWKPQMSHCVQNIFKNVTEFKRNHSSFCVFYIYFAEWVSSFDMKMIKRIFEEVSCLHVIECVPCWKLEKAQSLN